MIRDMKLRRTLLTLACFGIASVASAQDTTPFTVQADKILDRFVPSDGPSASVTVTRDGKVIYETARGNASLELHTPAKSTDVYRIGSITKTVTAAAVLLLDSQGRLRITDPLSKYLPDYPGGAGITLAELLNHTAGISDAWDADPNKTLDTKTLVDLISKQPVDFTPGSEWRYSNSGYMLLGAVIERVTGESWHRFEREAVLERFGMTHTGYYADDVVVPGAVQGYSADTDGKVAKPPFVPITGPMTAGALASTSGDIAHLAEGLSNPKLYPREVYTAMTSPTKLPDGSVSPYSYGLFHYTLRGEPAFGHNGGIEGFNSQFIFVPRSHVVVAVLANSDAGTPSARAIALQLAAAAIGRPYRSFTDKALSESEKKNLVGNYQIQGDQVHALTEEGGEIYVQRAPGPKRHLIPAEGDLLYYAGEATDYFHVVKAPDGKVTSLEFYTDGMGPARKEPRTQ